MSRHHGDISTPLHLLVAGLILLVGFSVFFFSTISTLTHDLIGGYLMGVIMILCFMAVGGIMVFIALWDVYYKGYKWNTPFRFLFRKRPKVRPQESEPAPPPLRTKKGPDMVAKFQKHKEKGFVCENCGTSLPQPPIKGVDVTCPQCQRVWRISKE